MPHNTGTHHLNRRKRIHQKHELYPHPEKLKNTWDKVMYCMAILVPLFTSAQIFKIWTTQSAEDVSILAWGTYLINSAMWLIYGILHKEGPIILNNIVCFFINLGVAVGIILYG